MTNGAMYCNRCGAQNSALAKFCANCGSPFAGESPATVAVEPEIVPRPQGPAQHPASTTPSGTTAASPTQAVRYGGFWIRFVAVLIDAIVVGIVVLPVSAVIALVIGIAGSTVAMPSVGVHLVRVIVAIGLNTCANWLYEAGFESSSKQATLGKMVLGLKVTDLEGRRISFARATGRHFAKILSGMILLIGYIMAGFTERKQALHDMIAGTLVIKVR